MLGEGATFCRRTPTLHRVEPVSLRTETERTDMDFGAMFRVLLRRWRVTAPVLFLGVLVVIGLYVKVPISYQSQAEIALIGSPSTEVTPGSGNNPYLDLGILDPWASILASNLSSDQSAQELQSLGVTDSFTAQVPASAAGPFVDLSLEDHSQTAISQSWPTVVRFAEEHLLQLQKDSTVKIPARGLIQATVIAAPSTPKPVLKRKLELVAGAAVLSLIAMLVLSFIAEAKAVRRASEAELNNRSRHVSRQPQRTEDTWRAVRTQ
jgi:uncharacterized protein involved in exopolysaccharide biosynthesis